MKKKFSWSRNTDQKGIVFFQEFTAPPEFYRDTIDRISAMMPGFTGFPGDALPNGSKSIREVSNISLFIRSLISSKIRL